MDVLIGLDLGALFSLAIVLIIRLQRSKTETRAQSLVLLEKVRAVCKLITVEGDFAEIYHFENVKEKFLKLLSSKKKALIIVEAKAHVGFDLSKIQISADIPNKRIILSHFPEPEVLSVETNLQYYDKREGYFNKFDANDLTELDTAAKSRIRAKIPESGLFETAMKEAHEVVQLMSNIVETIGWKLDDQALQLPVNTKKLES